MGPELLQHIRQIGPVSTWQRQVLHDLRPGTPRVRGASFSGADTQISKPCPDFLGRDRDDADLDRLPINSGSGFWIGRSVSRAAMDFVTDGQRNLDSISQVLREPLRE